MPNNWNTYKLSQVIKIVGGGTPKTSEPKYWDGNIPWLSVKDFQGERKFVYETEKTISDEGLKKSSTKLLPKDSIIISARGTVGELAVLGKEMTFNQSCYGILPNEKVDNQYLYYLLKQKVLELQSLSYGSVFDTITTKTFDGLDVKIPENLQEQQSIASVLSAIDDKIENNLAINKTLEEMAMALYKHWFVDFGPFQDGEFVESELGMIPKGWEVKRVKDFGDVITGKTPEKKSPEHFGDVIPFITPTDFKDYGKHIIGANRYISELGIKKLNKNILPINSVIVTCIGSDMGKVALSKTQSLTNQQINSLKSEHYLYMYCFFINNYTLLKRMAGDGTTMPIINKSSFENIKVIYPSKILLNDFEKFINDYDEQILSNTLENQTLAQLRDTLLPQLISGAVRLKEFRE
jgi:type I restriction enzyme S subunit